MPCTWLWGWLLRVARTVWGPARVAESDGYVWGEALQVGAEVLAGTAYCQNEYGVITK